MPRNRQTFTERRLDKDGTKVGFVVRHRDHRWWGVVKAIHEGGTMDVVFKQPGKQPDMLVRNLSDDCIETSYAVHRRHEEKWRRETGSPPLEETVDPGQPWREDEEYVVAEGFKSMGSRKLGELLGRSASSVTQKWQELKRRRVGAAA